MNVPFFDLKRQFAEIKADILPVTESVMISGDFTLGKHLEDFEENFARFCGKKYCVGVASGTDAIELALWAYGLKEGEVISVANTFIASVTPVSRLGLHPVLVDADPETGTIDIDELKRAITPRTKAIIPVDFYGQPADLDPILEVAGEKGLVVIEDACQAHGAKYKGKTVPIAETGCFSFYPGKNLGAFGEGGAVVTNDEEIAERVRLLRHHGQEKKNVCSIRGVNSRLHNMQAAILDIKLKHLNAWNAKRRKCADIYNRGLRNLVSVPEEAEYARHVYHLYVIETQKRDALQEYLNRKGIGTGIHYPTPIHLQPAYKHLGYKKGSFPVAESKSRRILSLPMFSELTEGEVEYVIESIKEFFT